MINYYGAKLSNEKGLRAQAKKGRERHQGDAIKWKAKEGVKRKGVKFLHIRLHHISAVQTLIKFYHTRERCLQRKQTCDRDLKTPTVYSGMFHFVNDNNIHLAHKATWE